MLLDTVRELSETSQSQRCLRPLGSFEELLWLMDKRSPLHATLIAHIDGTTTTDQWKAALQHTRRRHPLWSAVIAETEDGRPFFQSIPESEIPLRVIEGDFSQSWEKEVAWQLSIPIDAENGSLVRATLLHTNASCMLILTAHHSICDGMSLAFAIRDALQALSGSQLKDLSLQPSQEDALKLSSRPRARMGTVDHRLQQAPSRTVYRASSSMIPEVSSLQFSGSFTEALRNRARQEGTTVHAALIAAAGIAARLNPDYGSGRDLHVCSPINNRTLLGSPEDCALLFTAADSCILDEPAEDFWGLTRRSKSLLSLARTVDGARAVLGAVDGIVQRGLHATSAAEEGAKLFLFDLMLTNLGAVPIETSYGFLLLRDLWGPAVLVGLEGEQTLGVSTFNGRLCLLHTSHSPLPGFLDQIESILTLACAP